MHKRGERRSQRASTMSFNSVSEAEKCIEMRLKWSFFSGGEEEEEEEEGRGSSAGAGQRFYFSRPTSAQNIRRGLRKSNREVLASRKDQHKVVSPVPVRCEISRYWEIWASPLDVVVPRPAARPPKQTISLQGLSRLSTGIETGSTGPRLCLKW